MNEAYRHKSLAPDEYIGRVDEEGRTYASHGSQEERFVGHVDIISGEIFESRLGPEKAVGFVELDSGKVYQKWRKSKKILGLIDKDGKCTGHLPHSRDEYLGKVSNMTSFAHGGAAFLLLIYPRSVEDLEEKEAQIRERNEKKAVEGDQAGAENLKPA